MSNIALFAVGSFVTLLVASSTALLVWGAIMDGRYARERQVTETDAAGDRSPAGAPPAVDADGHSIVTGDRLAGTIAE